MLLEKIIVLEHFDDVFSKAGVLVRPSSLSLRHDDAHCSPCKKVISYHYKITLVCLLELESRSQATQLSRWHCLARFLPLQVDGIPLRIAPAFRVPPDFTRWRGRRATPFAMPARRYPGDKVRFRDPKPRAG